MQLDHLYRFRSTHALLSGFNELEAQQIYFCPPDKLNDPLEGFKDIFWQGDKIVWRNLLRHYLLNLLQATAISTIMGQAFSPNVCTTLVHQTDEDLAQTPIRNIYSAICRRFFRHPGPGRLITTLSSQKKAVRRDELIFYLRLLHPLATRCVLTTLAQNGLLPKQSAVGLGTTTKAMCRNLNDLLRVHVELGKPSSDTIFSISERTTLQLALIHEFNNPVDDERRSWFFISRDFPSYYVTAIERLLYPDWHVACFVADPCNASMWGTYGNSHMGVCLKFKTHMNDQGSATLPLYRISSWGGSKNGLIAHYSYVPHPFEQVQYTADFPEVDFFESIATLPIPKLMGFWFTGPNGERSTTASRMLREDEAWRQEYWQKFSSSFRTKSPEWQHEKEYRLLLYSALQRFDEMDTRKLKYKFSDLTGIIFGIKTTTEDKLHIMKIIEQKCLTEERYDFEFHQAYYSHETKKIELAPLTLLKVKM